MEERITGLPRDVHLLRRPGALDATPVVADHAVSQEKKTHLCQEPMRRNPRWGWPVVVHFLGRRLVEVMGTYAVEQARNLRFYGSRFVNMHLTRLLSTHAPLGKLDENGPVHVMDSAVAPVGPVSPVAPVGPVTPVDPVGPVAPVAPVGLQNGDYLEIIAYMDALYCLRRP